MRSGVEQKDSSASFRQRKAVNYELRTENLETDMAACTATLFDTKPGWTARVAERNAALLAQQPMRRRGVRTPEVIFTHHIDNTRLVKAPDPVRARQMRTFSAALTVLFSLIMFYGLQHFNVIENSYRIESEK